MKLLNIKVNKINLFVHKNVVPKIVFARQRHRKLFIFLMLNVFLTLFC